MKTKKNSTITEKFSLRIPRFKYLKLECMQDNKIQNLILKLSKEDSLETQIAVLKEFQIFLNDKQDEKNLCLVVDILVYFYLNLNSKHVLQKTIHRILLAANGSTNIIIDKINENLQLIIKHSAGINNDIVNGIGNCFENFPPGIVAISLCLCPVIEFLTKQFEGLLKLRDSSNSNEISIFLHNVVRVLVCVLQQSVISNGRLDQFWLNLLQCANNVIESDVTFDLKSNASIILITAANHMQKYNLSWVVILDSCIKGEILPLVNLNNEICIFVGILNVIPSEELFSTKISSEFISEIICTRLLELSESSSNNPPEIIQINRVLVVLFRSVPQSVAFNEIISLLELGLKYICTHLDHYIDTVRHSTKLLLSICIKIITSREKAEREMLLTIVFLKVNQLSALRSSKYIAITVLSQAIGCNAILNAIPELGSTLISYLIDPSITIYVSTAYESLMKQNVKEVDEEIWLKRWIYPLINNVQSSKNHDLLAYGFILNSTLLKSLQWENLMNNEDLLKIFLKVVKKSNGSIHWRDLVNIDMVKNATYHQSNEVRVSVLSLIIDSRKTTEKFTEWEFEFLLNYFQYNSNTQDPATRQEIVSLFKKMLRRFKDSYSLLLKQVKISPDYYLPFINKFRDMLFENLFIGASYGRRVTILELLVEGQHIFASYCSIENIRDEIKVLKHCLNDSYESNKKYAFILLQTYPSDLLELQPIQTYIQEASSIRPAECISAAYKIQLTLQSGIETYAAIEILMGHLQQQFMVAKSNILQAAASGPMYGVLFCIRHLVEHENFSESSNCDWKTLIDSLIKISFDLSAVVSPIINNSSPEGHFPEEVATDKSVTAQMVLICAWRTAKEVSLLLGELSSKSGNRDINDGSLVTQDQLLEMGNHFISVLTETKHRGAFEQAYIGFNKLCIHLWRCTSPTLNLLPKHWLTLIMTAVVDTTSKSKLCATRRSAGVPFMVQVLITSQLGTGHTDNFTECISGLLNVARNNENVESRTHALNILRGLYRHNQLGELVSPYVGDGLEVALTGFTSKAWSERNSSTLLFASLMIRIFGVQRIKDSEIPSTVNCLSARVFFLRYPSLQGFLLQQLSGRHTTVLYPILLLLARLYPCSVEEDTWLKPFLPHVLRCLSSKSLKTRQLAARALAPMLQHCSLKHTSILMAELMDVTVDMNYCHGLLVLIVLLLKNGTISLKRNNYFDAMAVVKSSVWILMCCETVAILYVQFLIVLTTTFKDLCVNNDLWKTLLTILERLQATISEDKTYFAAIQHLKLHINANLITSEENVAAVTDVIFRNCRAKSITCKIFALNIINYLNNIERNPLYSTGELEFSEFEYEFVKSLNSKMRSRVLEVINLNISKHIQDVDIVTHNSDYMISFYLFLSNYPSLITEIYSKKAKVTFFVLDELLKTLGNDYDNLNGAILSTIHAYLTLSALNQNQMKDLYMNNLLNALQQFSEPQISISCRLIVANIVNSFMLLKIKDIPIESQQRIWIIKLQLHEDEDQIVRDCISGTIISEKSREILLNGILNNLPKPHNIALLLNVALRSRNFEAGQLFETDEWNDYSEQLLLTRSALEVIKVHMKDELKNEKCAYDYVRVTFDEVFSSNLLTVDLVSLNCIKNFICTFKDLHRDSVLRNSIVDFVMTAESMNNASPLCREKIVNCLETISSLW